GGAPGLGLLCHRDDAEGFRVRSGGARRRAESALLPRPRHRADRHRPGLSARRLRASATADLTVLTASAVGATPVASLKGVAARGLAGKPRFEGAHTQACRSSSRRANAAEGNSYGEHYGAADDHLNDGVEEPAAHETVADEGDGHEFTGHHRVGEI